MKYLDLTLPTPQHNLACDEALLDLCEDGLEDEILRFWEPLEYFVVLGYSNKTALEINEVSCRALEIPVLRRVSGGGTVLQGPGCLNMTLILKIEKHEALKGIAKTNGYVLEKHRRSLEKLLGSRVEVQGTSDLTWNNLKFSGNAQRRRRRFLLFHGTFLHSFDVRLVEKTLKMPSKEPPYRQNRKHKEFLTNLNVPCAKIKEALRDCWNTETKLPEIYAERTERLVKEKYSKDEWNLKY